jgi:hypothetical protein
MARIELRDTTIYIQDGLSGSATVEEATPGATDTDVDINTVVLNSTITTLVPVGARFTVNTANNVTTYTVTARYGVNEQVTVNIDDASSGGNFTLTFGGDTTANIAYDAASSVVESELEALTAIGANNVSVTGGPGPTTDWVIEFVGTLRGTDVGAVTGDGSNLTGGSTVVTITVTVPGDTNTITNVEFTPAWGTYPPSTSDVVTFISQRIEVKIGEGNISWTEAKEYEYLLDRGDLDTVKEGDEQPLEVSLEFVYEHITTGTGEDITPVDALKQQNEASEWVSSSSDLCEPYAIDMIVMHCVPCGSEEDEQTVFSDFRYESLDFDLSEATIAVSGRCNVSEATPTRGTMGDCSA